jgi:flagellar motor protein MotB
MVRSTWTIAGVLCTLALSGCASKTKQRLRVLEAENVDQRQQIDLLGNQLRDTQSANDRAYAEVKQKEDELAIARQQAAQNDAAKAQLIRVQGELTAAQQRLEDANHRLALASKPAPTPVSASSPQLEAFRNDLQARLARYGASGVDVDVRTAQDGQRRIALVLQNTFRPGGNTLSYNATAVKAIVSVGKLVQEAYPGSRVSIEGHTDSDPIRKSKWESNEALSLARAEEVKKILSQAGVPGGRVAAVGLGSRQPIARGATERAKAQNRRVEIFIYPAV